MSALSEPADLGPSDPRALYWILQHAPEGASEYAGCDREHHVQ